VKISLDDKCTVSSSGDLFMDSAARPFIGQEVVVTGTTKEGLYIVRAADGSKLVVPKKNLEPVSARYVSDS